MILSWLKKVSTGIEQHRVDVYVVYNICTIQGTVTYIYIYIHVYMNNFAQGLHFHFLAKKKLT